MSKRISVKKSESPESKVVLASAIVNIGNAAKKLGDSGLNEKAIIALLHDATKLPKRDIKTVLDSLKQLERCYCK